MCHVNILTERKVHAKLANSCHCWANNFTGNLYEILNSLNLILWFFKGCPNSVSCFAFNQGHTTHTAINFKATLFWHVSTTKFLSNVMILTYFIFWSWQLLFDLVMSNCSNQTLPPIQSYCSSLWNSNWLLIYFFNLPFKEPKVLTFNSR